MPTLTLSQEEIVQRGEELYARDIRALVEPRYDGQIIVIDTASGDYEIADDTLTAYHRLIQKRPEAVPFTMRVGYDAVYAFPPATLRRTKQ